MIENLRLSLRGIRSHRMRSALTMLGIVIGIAAIIVIVSIIGGASAQLKDQMVGGRTNTVNIQVFTKDQSYMAYDAYSNGPIQGITDIPDSVVKQVLAVDGISKAARVYVHEYAMSTTYLDISTYTTTYGVDLDYFPISELTLNHGRLFTQNDYDNKNNVAVVSNSLAEELFKNSSALGKTIYVGHELFTVVGVVGRVIDYSEINNITDYYMKFGFDDKSVFIPTAAWNDAAGYDDIQSLVVKIDNPDNIVAAATKAADIMNDSIADINNQAEYKSGTLSEDAEYLKEITSIISVLLIGIASISLVVGGIGVMNIMLVSVTERTREIGLKKALGAKRRLILGQFLTESVVLTGIGGVLGVLLGIGIAKLVGMIVQMPTAISPLSIAISVGFSMSIGIIFGLVPSIKAANLNPIDALRYE